MRDAVDDDDKHDKDKDKDKENKKDKKSEDEIFISDTEKAEISQILQRQKAQEQLQTWITEIRESAYVEIKL